MPRVSTAVTRVCPLKQSSYKKRNPATCQNSFFLFITSLDRITVGMNNKIKHVERINAREMELGFCGDKGKGSWHDDYKDSPYIYVGGLNFDLTEGDLLRVFSQFGEIGSIDLIRDKKTGKSKGFCFIGYCDQRSTVLAVDNMNGVQLVGRIISVDHKKDYKPPKDKELDNTEAEEENNLKRKRPLDPLRLEGEEEEEDDVPLDKKELKRRRREEKNRIKEEKRKKKLMLMAFSQTTSTTLEDLEDYVKEKEGKKDKKHKKDKKEKSQPQPESNKETPPKPAEAQANRRANSSPNKN